ncbi:MAG: DNA-processing protein DprA [Polyangiaceae bacterium]
MTLDHLTPLDPAYPNRLRALGDAPASMTLRGGPLDAEHTVAIVGSREPTHEALAFANDLSSAVARTGAVVVSGGALGIDAAAHVGALNSGGRTWAVAATGHEHCFPAAHAQLFETIARGPGTMIWPFASGYAGRGGFLARNRVLVGLADVVVVVQAGFPSGALSSAGWARRLGKPLWVVPAPPWMDGFAGSRQLIDQGARPLTSIPRLLESLDLRGPSEAKSPPPEASASRPLSSSESSILASMSSTALHTDAIALRAGETCSAAAAALLTLALENVVVEGPPGFFRRGVAHNR